MKKQLYLTQKSGGNRVPCLLLQHDGLVAPKRIPLGLGLLLSGPARQTMLLWLALLTLWRRGWRTVLKTETHGFHLPVIIIILSFEYQIVDLFIFLSSPVFVVSFFSGCCHRIHSFFCRRSSFISCIFLHFSHYIVDIVRFYCLFSGSLLALSRLATLTLHFLYFLFTTHSSHVFLAM